MFLSAFKNTGVAVGQIFILGTIGYFLVKSKLLKSEGLDALSWMTLDLTLPLLIFCQLLGNFSFRIFDNWWQFPLLSVGITLFGMVLGSVFLGLIKEDQRKRQFLTLVGFQNSGYLPLALIGTVFTGAVKDMLFIYLFLFLIGFNLLMFSLGVHILSSHKDRKAGLASLFNPPVAAAIISLILIFFGLNKFIPAAVIKPLNMIGECTLPLSMLVVGGNLAQIRIAHVNKKEMILVMALKLIIMPLAGLLVIKFFRLPEFLGLLLIIQLAMPPAATPSVILRHHKKDDLMISQGIFFGHILSIITIPIFLSIYFALTVIK